METGKDLIDRARCLGFSDAYLAERIGVSRSYISHVAAERKSLSPESAAMLAALCGEDPTEALKAQTVANEKNPDRKARLAKVLFMSALLASGASSQASDWRGTMQTASTMADVTIYTLSRIRTWLSRRAAHILEALTLQPAAS